MSLISVSVSWVCNISPFIRQNPGFCLLTTEHFLEACLRALYICQSKLQLMHSCFCSPAHIMPLLEIVRTQRTSAQVVLDLLDVAKKIRKTPIVVGNCTGFAVNRMFFPYTQAALLLVDRGLDVYQIDQAITQFGMPMGPFRYWLTWKWAEIYI